MAIIKESASKLLDEIDSLTEQSIKELNCSLEECFPARCGDIVYINGQKYGMSVEVKLIELR